MIIAAVIRVAVLRPSVRASEVLDSAFPDCWPDTTSEGVGSLLIFELRSHPHHVRIIIEHWSAATQHSSELTLRLPATSRKPS